MGPMILVAICVDSCISIGLVHLHYFSTSVGSEDANSFLVSDIVDKKMQPKVCLKSTISLDCNAFTH